MSEDQNIVAAPAPVVVDVNSAWLVALRHLASTDETRWSICGVHLEIHADGKVLMVATDGRRLGVYCNTVSRIEGEWPDKDKAPLHVTIGPFALQMIRKLMKESDKLPGVELRFDLNSRIPTVHATVNGTASFQDRLIEDDFPIWRPTFKGPFENGSHITLNAEYLYSFWEVASEAGVLGYGHGATIDGGSNDSPMRIQFKSVPEFAGLLMPMHIPGEWSPSTPAWIECPSQKAA